MKLEIRDAVPADVRILARMNEQLIRDEKHRNPMSPAQLEERMARFLAQGYHAILIVVRGRGAGYLLYRPGTDEYDPTQAVVFVRQFLVMPRYRRRGLGRAAFELAVEQRFPAGARINLEVLAHNQGGRRFWKALGFRPYSITLMRQPGRRGTGGKSSWQRGL